MSRKPVQISKEAHSKLKLISIKENLSIIDTVDKIIDFYINPNGNNEEYEIVEFHNGAMVRQKKNGYVSLKDVSGKYEEWLNAEDTKDFIEDYGSTIDEDGFADPIIAMSLASWADKKFFLRVAEVYFKKGEKQ